MPEIPKPVALITVAVLGAVGLSVFLWSQPERPVAIPPHPEDNETADPILSSPIPSGGPPVTAVESTIRFARLPQATTGIDFQYYGSPSDQHYMTEQNGGGIGVLDFDADDQPDLFFVNGSHFQHPANLHGASHQLYRGRGEFRFQEVTSIAGLTASEFGAGCTAGDYNNDGFSDLFVACYGPNRLWRNNGDGTYSEVSAEAVVDHAGFGSSAAFADLDGDGHLDLYVVNYLDWVPDETPRERIQSPMDFEGQADLLYRNDGKGGFVEVGEEAEVAISHDGKGLAVAIADLDGDRQLDVYVANDTRRNFLFRNLGNLHFEEIGVRSGSAVSQDGSIGSSMGIAVTDYNLDQKPDLLITNFAHEVVDVLMNIGDAGFIATNTELGVDTVSGPVLNFGIICADFDLDLWPDLFFANGHLWDDTLAGGEYRMLPSLLQNRQGTRFFDAASQAGEYFQQRWLGRAAAMGDLDNDGDTDLVVSHLLATPAILANESHRQGRSQRFLFIGTSSSRQPLGCEVNIELLSGKKLTMHVPAGGSFQASHDPVVVVPTGTAGMIQQISICWSDGSVEAWTNPPVEDTVKLRQGTGRQ